MLWWLVSCISIGSMVGTHMLVRLRQPLFFVQLIYNEGNVTVFLLDWFNVFNADQLYKRMAQSKMVWIIFGPSRTPKWAKRVCNGPKMIQKLENGCVEHIIFPVLLAFWKLKMFTFFVTGHSKAGQLICLYRAVSMDLILAKLKQSIRVCWINKQNQCYTTIKSSPLYEHITIYRSIFSLHKTSKTI